MNWAALASHLTGEKAAPHEIIPTRVGRGADHGRQLTVISQWPKPPAAPACATRAGRDFVITPFARLGGGGDSEEPLRAGEDAELRQSRVGRGHEACCWWIRRSTRAAGVFKEVLGPHPDLQF